LSVSEKLSFAHADQRLSSQGDFATLYVWKQAAWKVSGALWRFGTMSALGHKRTSKYIRAMSALPAKADIAERRCDVTKC
jgi:hypothetical protein